MEEPRLSAKELHLKTYKIIRNSASPSVRKLIQIDEILKGIEDMPDSKFEDFEKLRRNIEKDMKGDKKNEKEN